MLFPPAGAQRHGGHVSTPPHKYRAFEFKAYAPRLFHSLRGLAGVEDHEYSASLTNQLVMRTM